MIEVLRDSGLSRHIPADSSVERVADGFQFTEGPLWRPDGALLFQDIKAERTYLVAPDGSKSVLREDTGAANGQTYLPDGRVVFCEQIGRRVSTMAADGTDVRMVTELYQGKRLNSPNDVVCRADGRVYFTDPPYGVSPAERSLHFQGVFSMDPDGGSMRLELDDFEKPNGLAFSPDGGTLYVCDTARDHVRAFDVGPSGDVGPGRVFCTLDPGVPGGPDGLKVDRDGRVYVAVALGVWVYEPDGHLLGIIALPERPSNLNWSGPAADTLAITAVDKVYRIKLGVSGLAPIFQPPTIPG